MGAKGDNKRSAVKKILVTLFFAFTGLSAFSQASAITTGPATSTYRAGTAGGYYVKNGRITYALLSLEREELRAVRVYIPQQLGHDHEILSPDEVSEWGIEDGGQKRYISALVQTSEGEKRRFLEDLQETGSGSHILYLSRLTMPDDTYFLYSNGQVSELATRRRPQPMWDYFSSLNDCTSGWTIDAEYPKRLRPAMVRRYYNAFAFCNEKMFPKPRFGITVSAGLARPTIHDQRMGFVVDVDESERDAISLTNTRYLFRMAYSAGIFFRFPMEEVISFQPEIQYFYQSSKGTKGSPWSNPVSRTLIEFENHSLRVPLMFRFTNNYAKKKLMPYAELGPVFHANFGKYGFEGTDRIAQRKLPLYTIGFAAGFGMERYITAGQAFSIGARVNWEASVDSRERTYNNLSVELVVGFSLFKM
jgi:hypothetical protein